MQELPAIIVLFFVCFNEYYYHLAFFSRNILEGWKRIDTDLTKDGATKFVFHCVALRAVYIAGFLVVLVGCILSL